MNFSNTYIHLNDLFYKKNLPTKVKDPQLFLWNTELADELMVRDTLEDDPAVLAGFFGGNSILPGAEPIATAYAGHQFGGFVPQLGDGRAHLLGEVINRSGQRVDIQLKGSGPTFYSRGGDGRCAIGPAVREFIMGEAMYALGVPTTRSLAVVTTGEPVFRQTPSPGAVVTRVASSHIRVGTFQFLAARDNHEAIKALCDYTIERHYPELLKAGDDQYVLLIDRFIENQIHLVTEWMRVGFIHGVMNTDNTALSGETIDYGPCAMMGVYHPDTVFSSIDTTGRYAFGNQSLVARWNSARFAECLLPLIDTEPDTAIKKVEPLIQDFSDRFKGVYQEMMAKKLGLSSFQQDDQRLIFSLLKHVEEKKMDYTITFNRLMKSLISENAQSELNDEFDGWLNLWKKRLTEQSDHPQVSLKLMRENNPVVIPRNHHMESVITACEAGSSEKAEQFLEVLGSPYEETEESSHYQDAPEDGDAGYKTFCGT